MLNQFSYKKHQVMISEPMKFFNKDDNNKLWWKGEIVIINDKTNQIVKTLFYGCSYGSDMDGIPTGVFEQVQLKKIIHEAQEAAKKYINEETT